MQRGQITSLRTVKPLAERHTDMTNIPDNTVTQEDLEAWFVMKKKLSDLKAAEGLLRAKIFNHYFPDPVEGTNSVPLADDYVLKGVHSITRKLDIGVLQALSTSETDINHELETPFEQHGINVDKLVEYKPSLVMKEYRTLTAEQAVFFDQCLDVKPGSPTLSIVLPKKAAKAGDTA